MGARETEGLLHERNTKDSPGTSGHVICLWPDEVMGSLCRWLRSRKCRSQGNNRRSVCCRSIQSISGTQ